MAGEQAERGSLSASLFKEEVPVIQTPPALTYLGQNCVWSLRWRRERNRTSPQNPQPYGNVTPVPFTPSRKVLIVTTLLPLLTLRFVILKAMKE